jgi:replicative DNA helicase
MTSITEPREMPHRREAEAAVLGGILTRGSDALDVVLEIIGEDDFHVPSYQATFRAMCLIEERGDSIDVITLESQLRRTGELELVGGIESLARLDRYATAHNIKAHAEIILEASRLRAIAKAGRAMAEAAMDPDADHTAIVGRAEKAVRDAAGLSKSAGPRSAKELMLEVFQGVTERQRSTEQVTGVATEFYEIDEMTAGLQPGDLVILAARPSMGKAQPLDAKVLTASGFVAMAEVAVGTELVSVDGEPSVVTGVFPQSKRQVYRVTLLDGRSTECCAEHLWSVTSPSWSGRRVLTTDAMAALLDDATISVPTRSVSGEVEVASIEPTRVTATQCIAVSHPSRLYVTDDYIVTHNTAFALNIAANACVMPQRFVNAPEEAKPKRVPVLFFSLEMGATQLIERMLCSEARVDYQLLRRGGRMSTSDFEKLIAAAQRIADAPLYIDDQAALSITEMRGRARRWRENRSIFPDLEPNKDGKVPTQLGLVMIDYLQLARGGQKKYGSRENEISEISQGLKAMAKELKVPVIALSQLNRAVDARADHRPQLSDLRESGAIEQDADVIMFIYREERYLPPTATEEQRAAVENTAEIGIAKQRNGPVGTVNLTFVKHHTRFENPAREYDGP